MSSRYPILDNRPIDQWKVTELKEELKKRKLTTRGLKEELIKRLDESIRSENEKANLNSDGGRDSDPQSEALSEQEKTERHLSEKSDNDIDLSDSTFEKHNENDETQLSHEEETTDAKASETAQDTTAQAEQVSAKVDDDTPTVGMNEISSLANEEKIREDTPKVDTNETGGSENEEKTRELEIRDASGSAELEKNQAALEAEEVTTETATENMESVVACSGQDLQGKSEDLVSKPERDELKAQLENDVSKHLHTDDNINKSDPYNQVSEVKTDPVLGFEVKSDSNSTETVSINEQNELKDNIIADDVKLELDVKPEMVQPSSSNPVPDGGESHPMDVEEPHTNQVSVEEIGGNGAEDVNDSKKNDSGDLGSEKLNLGSNSGDGFMEEDVIEGKQIDSKSISDEVGVKTEKVEVAAKEEGLVDIVGEDMPTETKVTIVDEKNGPTASSVKRKLNDQQTGASNDTSKRQRRWNAEGLKISEPRSGEVLSATPKETFLPAAFKRSFSRSDSNVSEESPKERVVPPSSKPPTNSLRIDRFLRPFTLKAVQELLGKTGNVTYFWMDHIKTHCFVSYSTVEEAVETRNAVYNLQWPPNGGRQLVAEFVDPQEVKARLEAPPQPPAAPANSVSGASIPHASQSVQPPQPSPRQQVQKQQHPPPPPPPPQMSNPPTPRDHPAPVRERLTLPPPPPLPQKVEPPIVTLDDLFRKTKATPRIYYLPLSDEQVAAKLQAQGKTAKQ